MKEVYGIMEKGKIIVIEGIDGTGKETQSKLLQKELKKLGIESKMISFPNYNSQSSGPIKLYLNGEISKDLYGVSAEAASMMYAIDRYITLKRSNIEEDLDNGIWYIFDRYTQSNLIHQAIKYFNERNREGNIDYIKFYSILTDIENNMLKIPKADIVFYLDMDIELSKKLRENRLNKIDNSEDQDIHESDNNYLNQCAKIGRGYANMLKWNKIYSVSEDGERLSPKEVNSKILQTIKETIK